MMLSKSTESLLKEERQRMILEILQENSRVTVAELSKRFAISQVTIRRDLAELAASGQLIRAHRGALPVIPAPSEPPVIQRMMIEREAKEAIARAAIRLVKDGDTLFIGSGSTMACFARCLVERKGLMVVTNALNIAVELASTEGEISIVVAGGAVRTPELSLLGHITELTLQEVRVNKIFMGAQALSIQDGWTSDHLPEVATTRKILEMSPELIVLADHTKLGCTAAAYLAPITRLTTLVTDANADPGFVEQLQAKGVQVILAQV